MLDTFGEHFTEPVFLYIPNKITRIKGTIAYIYTAQGEKLAKRMKDNTYSYYAGSMVYKNDKSLNYLLTPEGMVSKTSSVFTYEYHLKDHLGNTRVTFQPNGTTTTLTQATEYYPFGMNFSPQSPAGTNKYLYNGKEKQDDVLSLTALDLYDYGARFYDPMIGRWHSLDGKAEIYVNMTPYCYAANTPTNAIDPDGDIVIFINGFSYGGEGGTHSYWQKTETNTQAVRYTVFGHNLWNGNERQKVVTSDFAKSFCEKFGEDVTKAKFFDGAPFNSINFGFRNAMGYWKGMFNVEQLIQGLAKTGGVITEPLIIATHSMGSAYGRGFLDAILQYVKENPNECRGYL